MIGRKSLAEIRRELEAVMDQIPADAGAVTKALRAFLDDKPAVPATKPKNGRGPGSKSKTKTAVKK